MTSRRLQVVIVGAGLGGLAAGAFLREYADVTILESTSVLKEVGAALSIGAGGNKILRRFDIHLDQEGGIIPENMAIWTMDGNKIAEHPTPSSLQYGDQFVSIHRADMHSALLRAATKAEGPGWPCQVLLEHKVVDLDTEVGTVTAENGRTFLADVIIGADGIRSNIRVIVTGTELTPQPSGESLYRLLVHAKDLPIKHPLLVDGKIAKTMHMVKGPQRKIIAYPIRNGDILNLAAYVPDSELHEEVTEKWTSKGSLEAMLQSHSDFAPFWKNIIRSGKDVGVWQVRDMDPLDTWVKGRTVLIGDAAHPMVPHQAAGALSAIEDAEALHFTLRNATRANVHECLQRAFRIRYKRASDCQVGSRSSNLQAPPDPHAMKKLYALWDYPGAERWELDRPDIALPA